MDLVLLSPSNYFLYTPLLPSAATGTVEERSIVEPIRRIVNQKVHIAGSHTCLHHRVLSVVHSA